jgi:hypothetical protein
VAVELILLLKRIRRKERWLLEQIRVEERGIGSVKRNDG